MLVKIFETQIQNTSYIEARINELLTENQNYKIASIASSQGQDSSHRPNIVVVVTFTDKQ